MKTYQLMNKDIVLIEFQLTYSLYKSHDVLYYNEDSMVRKPKLLESKADVGKNLERWMQERVIPTNREHIEKVLMSVGYTEKEKFNLLMINHACSLNDTFWIKEKDELNIYGEALNWKDVSLYKGFKESLGLISFFGDTSTLGGRFKTPETTTQGMLRKAWRVIDGEIYLYKAATQGFANTGNEIYSEYIACQIAKILGINHVDYTIEKWKDIDCNACKIFTSEKIGYITMSEYINDKSVFTYNDTCKYLSKELIEKLNDMIVYDFIIENEDRHYNNFGMLIDNDTGEIIDFAPLFDNGFGLLHYEMESDFADYDYNKSKIGTFNRENVIQARDIVQNNPKKYKHWSKILMNSIDKINFDRVPEERSKGIKKLLENRCKMIEQF